MLKKCKREDGNYEFDKPNFKNLNKIFEVTQFPRYSIQEMTKNIHLTNQDVYGYVTAFFILFRKEVCYYYGCPTCKISVEETAHKCKHCNRDKINPIKYFKLIATIQDSSNQQESVILFDDVLDDLFGKTTDKMVAMQTNDTDDFYNCLKAKTCVLFKMDLKGKQELYKDSYRTAFILRKVSKPLYKVKQKYFIKQFVYILRQLPDFNKYILAFSLYLIISKHK
ncbi:hypothetical protein EIN_234200 [Entamoeba invadens IP1]|uniref:Replication factor A C-terminal domain-containing protein n=1 Tax=Entamoeba invadens IP1 TaxID=370355 RepID=L7FM91_ENTIV|nr:hypothetical protein EIN_234200 [Entamoeba invadens IP1]ELP86003.1 hypothetical protein EIN_234200 [Entamoeba invadens IP1]|eukprot:XP_004185349.1 hypothetical protein EIN_234200 [Entamoeba invadens IP1]